MAVTTIDEVLQALDAIIDRARGDESRLGYFAGLYRRVTRAVKDGIAGGRFQNGPRMERLDVVFASRYLDAFASWRNGQPASRSWLLAFETASDRGPLVLQHLLAGMNAHINLDLGIAAATIAPTPAALAALQADFLRINDVLSRLVRIVEDELCQICPPLQRLADVATIEEPGFDFGLNAARDIAWKLANDLVATPRERWDAVIATRDALTAVAGRALLRGAASITARLVLEHESKDIRLNIQVVAE